MTPHESTMASAVQSVLTAELLKPAYRRAAELSKRKFIGHCYVASEALYHLLGGKAKGYRSVNLSKQLAPEFGPHWWVESAGGEVIDVTAEQFDKPVPYGLGSYKAWITSLPKPPGGWREVPPSKAAIAVMQRTEAVLSGATPEQAISRFPLRRK